MLRAGELPAEPASALKVFDNNVRVTVQASDPHCEQNFPVLNPELDAFNFKRLPAGSLVCSLPEHSAGIRANDTELRDVTEDYFVIKDHEVRLRRDVIMSMYTRDPLIARQDCICYFLEPIAPAHTAQPA